VEQAKAQARSQAKEGDRLAKAVESRDSRIAVLVQEKQRLSEDTEQRLSQARATLSAVSVAPVGHCSLPLPKGRVGLAGSINVTDPEDLCKNCQMISVKTFHLSFPFITRIS
jgi:hypothetical protein